MWISTDSVSVIWTSNQLYLRQSCSFQERKGGGDIRVLLFDVTVLLTILLILYLLPLSLWWVLSRLWISSFLVIDIKTTVLRWGFLYFSRKNFCLKMYVFYCTSGKFVKKENVGAICTDCWFVGFFFLLQTYSVSFCLHALIVFLLHLDLCHKHGETIQLVPYLWTFKFQTLVHVNKVELKLKSSS